MAPKKLTESDKQDILNRYRQSEETAASLATQYGVSTSTVSRLLKQSIPEREYEALVQQKRSGARTAEPEELPNIDAISAALAVVLKADRADRAARLPPEPAQPEEADAAEEAQESSGNRRRRRSRNQAGSDAIREIEKQLEMLPVAESQSAAQLEETESDDAGEADAIQPPAALVDYPKLKTATPPASAAQPVVVPSVAEADEDDLDEDLDDEDDLDDLDDDLDDDEEDDEEDELNGDGAIEMMHVQGKGMVNVLPLSEAQIPRTCYVVVDRSAELITRPLKDFADLGQIPPGEVQAKTLPVFDNHRVAKRFLRRMQRIVKVPDGRMFQKVTPYLQAKGITRLLIDGQIYSI